MVVLIDTNVLIDHLETREPYFEDAYRVLLLCAEEKVEGYAAFHSIPNIFYIMRKTHDIGSRREMLNKSLQVQCAKEVKADYIITRNVNDYICSDVKAVTPKEFAEKLEESKGR